MAIGHTRSGVIIPSLFHSQFLLSILSIFAEEFELLLQIIQKFEAFTLMCAIRSIHSTPRLILLLLHSLTNL